MPVRTCLGCRIAAPAAELVRVTCSGDRGLVVGGPSSGRGVWIGPGPACWEAAKPRLARSLRVEVPQRALAAIDWGKEIAALGRRAEPPAWCPRQMRSHR